MPEASDNYNIFGGFFNYCNYNLRWIKQDYILKTVRSGTVVTLETTDIGFEKKITVCLDSETGFKDENNLSMGITHITPSDKEYFKMCGAGVKQELYFRGIKYRVVQIVPRIQYGLSYVFTKAQENPEMFKGVLWMISSKNTEEMICQMRQITDRSEQRKTVLDMYNFKSNELGLPIDSLALDNDNYINAFRYLLFAKDEAFYAGEPVYEDEVNQRYIPALSTLVLVAVLDCFYFFDGIKDDIVIPESYITFFKERYNNAIQSDIEERMKLYFSDGKPMLQKMDKTIPEIWSTVVSFCESCKKVQISDEERIEFELFKNYSGERLITDLKLSVIHLDAMILARKEKGTFLCDDLWFRKISSKIGIRTLNLVSIVEHYNAPDLVIPFILQLSKTNYIYIPLLYRNDKEAQELYHNILDGEKKSLYYGRILNWAAELRKSILEDNQDDMNSREILEQ